MDRRTFKHEIVHHIPGVVFRSFLGGVIFAMIGIAFVEFSMFHGAMINVAAAPAATSC